MGMEEKQKGERPPYKGGCNNPTRVEISGATGNELLTRIS